MRAAQPVHGGCPFLAGQLAENPALYRELTAAETLGISLRRFRGWEPIVRHWTDDDGTWSQAEPEWDEQQQAWMLALAMHRDSLCPNCRGVLADTAAPENEGKYRAQLPVKCFRCEAFGISHDAYADQPQPGSFLHLVLQKPR